MPATPTVVVINRQASCGPGSPTAQSALSPLELVQLPVIRTRDAVLPFNPGCMGAQGCRSGLFAFGFSCQRAGTRYG
jgi:hypothetical protein